MTRGAIAAAILAGLLCGVGIFTFGYARGSSYLTDNPQACANCHVMNDQYSGWLKSSHRSAAVCNDCHTPAGFIPKYAVKALNGFLHSSAFTTGHFPDNIQIRGSSRAITEASCQKCHFEMSHGIKTSCLSCHREVGHH